MSLRSDNPLDPDELCHSDRLCIAFVAFCATAALFLSDLAGALFAGFVAYLGFQALVALLTWISDFRPRR